MLVFFAVSTESTEEKVSVMGPMVLPSMFTREEFREIPISLSGPPGMIRSFR